MGIIYTKLSVGGGGSRFTAGFDTGGHHLHQAFYLGEGRGGGSRFTAAFGGAWGRQRRRRDRRTSWGVERGQEVGRRRRSRRGGGDVLLEDPATFFLNLVCFKVESMGTFFLPTLSLSEFWMFLS